MAAVAVVHDVIKTLIASAPANQQVTVTCPSLTWNVYCKVFRAGVQVNEPKVRSTAQQVFNILTGDRVDCWPTGTGNINVTAV